MEKETIAMEKRVMEFREKELENLKELQTRTYRERKVLWNKICEVKRWNPPPSSPQQKTQHPTIPEKKVNFDLAVSPCC
jgi:hypothetical protein